MKRGALIVQVGVMTLFLALVSCQRSSSLELVWSVRRGLVGQWGVRGEEVFVIGQHLGVYNLAGGRELRRVRLPKDYGETTFGEISPELAITDTSLVFAWYDFKDKEAKIFCYDPKTLALRWERGFPWPWDVRSTRPTFSVVVSGDHLYALALGKEGHNLFSLQLSDGKTVWSATIEKYVQGVPLVLHDGKLLVRSIVSVRHADKYGYLEAINPQSGENLWRVRIDGESTFDDPPLIFADRAYVTSQAVLSDPDHLYTIELARGVVVDHQRVRLLRAPFVQHQGILYFGGNTPAAFHIGRKEIVWQADLRGPQGLGTPVGALGVLDPVREEIYLGDGERDLYVLSARTGEVKDKISIRGYWRGEFFSPLKALFGPYGVKRLAHVRGLLFVGTVDSSLFVFRPRGQH